MEPIIVEMGRVISVLCCKLKVLSKRLRLIGQRGNLRALAGICDISLKLFLDGSRIPETSTPFNRLFLT